MKIFEEKKATKKLRKYLAMGKKTFKCSRKNYPIWKLYDPVRLRGFNATIVDKIYILYIIHKIL